MSITLKIANDPKEWDNLVDRCPYGTLFHTWNWLKIMEKHSWTNFLGRKIKPKLYPVIGLRGTTPVGVYPLYLYDAKIVKYLSSPPSRVEDTYLGPLFVDYNKLKQSKKESVFIDFQKEVDRFIFKDLKVSCVSISTSPGLNDSRPFKWAGYKVEPRYTYTLDLKKTVEDIWSGFSAQIRKDIRRMYKKGLTVEDGSHDDLKLIYKSLKDRRFSQDTIQRSSEEFINEIYDCFHENNLKIFVVRYNKEFISGSVIIKYKKGIFSWIGTTKVDLKGIYPNYLIQWEAIKWAHENGFEFYDLLGANSLDLSKFKSKFSSELLPYFSAEKGSLLFSSYETLKSILR